jgi:hypothetical protein
VSVIFHPAKECRIGYRLGLKGEGYFRRQNVARLALLLRTRPEDLPLYNLVERMEAREWLGG